MFEGPQSPWGLGGSGEGGGCCRGEVGSYMGPFAPNRGWAVTKMGSFKVLPCSIILTWFGALQALALSCILWPVALCCMIDRTILEEERALL